MKLLRDWLNANPKHAKAPLVFVALARVKDGGAPESAAAVLDALGVETAKFPKDDQFRLWHGLGLAAGRVADLQKPDDADAATALRAAALTYLRAAADLMPKELACRAALLDHGLAAGRMDVVKQALKEIAAVEGESGPVGALGHIAIKLPAVRNMTDGAQRAAAVEELRVDAVDGLRKAKGLGLTADDLHPIEFDKYKDLLGKYSLPLN